MLDRRYGGADTGHLGVLSLEVHCLKVADKLLEALTYAAVLAILRVNPLRATVCSLRSLTIVEEATELLDRALTY